MRKLVVLAVLALPSLAHADGPRELSLGVTGGAAVMGDPQAVGPDRIGSLIGASLLWDRPAPDYPDFDGTARARGDVVPEATLMALGDRGALTAGLRFGLDVAQRGMGLMHVSARMSIWLAPRVGVIDEGGSALAGGAFGEEFYLGKSDWRIGCELGVLGWKEKGSSDTIQPLGGAIQFRAPDPGAKQIAITMALSVTH